MSLRSPLGAALGHGSAKEGSQHWWQQRLSAIGLVPLGLWFLFAVLALPDFKYATVSAWLARPLNGVLMLLFLVVALWHSALGVQVVIEDYVGGRLRVPALVLSRYAHIIVGALAGFGILKLALGGA